jgi:hypothetical protein
MSSKNQGSSGVVLSYDIITIPSASRAKPPGSTFTVVSTPEIRARNVKQWTRDRMNDRKRRAKRELHRKADIAVRRHDDRELVHVFDEAIDMAQAASLQHRAYAQGALARADRRVS